MPEQEPIYIVHDERALRAGALPIITNGRIQGKTGVDLADLDGALPVSTVQVSYELFGPGDVGRLGGDAITRRFPAPGSSDAEETKLPLVEFRATDLPWRYTPEAAVGPKLRPWLVLVVGRRTPDELILRPDGRVGLGLGTQNQFPLKDSAQWAHVHFIDPWKVARIVAPIDLQTETDYVACLVPAFTAAGQDAWTGAAPVTVDCYDRWTFRTGPEGDFPELAQKLHPADLDAIVRPGGRPFGRAEVTYVRRDVAAPPPVVPPADDADDPRRVVLQAAGALRLPPAMAGGVAVPDPADAPPDPAIVPDVTALTKRIATPDGRGVVTAPRYDAPFATLVTQAAPSPDGWITQLVDDPRARGAAGIGAWNGVEWQDRIADAAAAKAGELAVAHDRIRHVALGIEASRSIWRRRVPQLPADLGADPARTATAAADVLATLGPVLARLPADGGNTVLAAIAGRTPQLGRALFSSAARRVLRPGTARTARAAEGAGEMGAMFRVANDCPKPPRDPAEIPAPREGPAEGAAEALGAAILAATGGDKELTEQILNLIRQFGDQPAAVAAALRALTPGKDGKPDPHAIESFLGGGDHPPLRQSLDGWSDWVDETAARERCEPVDLVRLAGVVAAAIDPTVAMPPAAQRVLSTLPGFTHIGPVEIEPELDLPLWSFLAKRSPDWMLPGAGDLREGDVVGLATNPAFVDALLIGANHQATAELRWRNVPMTTRWSPLRKFWQRGPGEFDIVPIKGWPDAERLGAAALTPGGRGSDAVVAFKTPLFRRYPATVVYLYPADIAFTPPSAAQPLDSDKRTDHTFTGTIGDDITFFGFPVDPAKLGSFWVVLEEPPAGYRFTSAGSPDGHSADFAHNHFALPVRVLIGPLL